MSTQSRTRDLAGGAVLLVFAAAMIWYGRNLPSGVGTRLGPGDVPRLLAILIGLVGIAIFVKALFRAGDPIAPSAPLRVGLVFLAMLFFILLLNRAGLGVAALALLFTSSVAAPDFRPFQAVIFSVALTAASAFLFVSTLGMNVRVLPW